MQAPDTKPGAYYVTIMEGTHKGARTGRLLGPFPNDHATALKLVDVARAKAEELNPRAFWHLFGTARWPEGTTHPGILNPYFPEVFA